MKPLTMDSLDFIGMAYLSDTSICDQLIKYHNDSLEKKEGLIGSGVNKDIKDSTDVSIHPEQFILDPIIKEYLIQLQEVCEKYIEKYAYCNSGQAWTIKDSFNIQHYAPKQGYFSYHAEKTGGNCDRHLTFMTYLNDIFDGGETEFYYQGIKIQPRKGLTLIWPVQWTHTHRGIISSTQDKYIATGWYEYVI